MLSTKPNTAARRPSLAAPPRSGSGALGGTTSTRVTNVFSEKTTDCCQSSSLSRISAWASRHDPPGLLGGVTLRPTM